MDDLSKAELRWSKTSLFRKPRRGRWRRRVLLLFFLAASAAGIVYAYAHGLFGAL